METGFGIFVIEKQPLKNFGLQKKTWEEIAIWLKEITKEIETETSEYEDAKVKVRISEEMVKIKINLPIDIDFKKPTNDLSDILREVLNKKTHYVGEIETGITQEKTDGNGGTKIISYEYNQRF